MFTVTQEGPGNILQITASGKLTKDDYDALAPDIVRHIEEVGPLRLYIKMEDFEGWDIGGLWADLTFDAKHHDDFERIAIVGDSRWQKWGVVLSKPFFDADVRAFEPHEAEVAWAWLRES